MAAPATDGPVGGGINKARGRQRTRGRAPDAAEREVSRRRAQGLLLVSTGSRS
jgi:hypothetical protein